MAGAAKPRKTIDRDLSFGTLAIHFVSIFSLLWAFCCKFRWHSIFLCEWLQCTEQAFIYFRLTCAIFINQRSEIYTRMNDFIHNSLENYYRRQRSNGGSRVRWIKYYIWNRRELRLALHSQNFHQIVCLVHRITWNEKKKSKSRCISQTQCLEWKNEQ